MNIYFGNIQFNQVLEKLGYKLTEEDRIIWNKYHNDTADLSGMESSFHVFEMPLCIKFKGEAAKQALFAMFTPDKIITAMGYIPVYEI